ncbi:hypothetical protein BDZ89DRAFT_1132384 [Hymenopellis radicata]|nr:hypothetical protein BDZ89DRAFT_1132384 [Hymenopellis radicata]
MVSSSPTALITMHNVKRFLQEAVFEASQEAREKGNTEKLVTVDRKLTHIDPGGKEHSTHARYIVVDSPKVSCARFWSPTSTASNSLKVVTTLSESKKSSNFSLSQRRPRDQTHSIFLVFANLIDSSKGDISSFFSLCLDNPVSRGTVIMSTTDRYAEPAVDFNTNINWVNTELFVCVVKFYRHGRGGSSELLVYGVAGFSVSDISVNSMIPVTHTYATVYAIAEKAADLIQFSVNNSVSFPSVFNTPSDFSCAPSSATSTTSSHLLSLDIRLTYELLCCRPSGTPFHIPRLRSVLSPPSRTPSKPTLLATTPIKLCILGLAATCLEVIFHGLGTTGCLVYVVSDSSERCLCDASSLIWLRAVGGDASLDTEDTKSLAGFEDPPWQGDRKCSCPFLGVFVLTLKGLHVHK